MKAENYLRYINLLNLFSTERTKDILTASPGLVESRIDADAVHITAYDYDAHSLNFHELSSVEESFAYRDNNKITWINIDGIRKRDVELMGEHFGIHPLIIEDILSMNQRPKMDEVDDVLFCLLNMLYFNEDKCE